MWLPSIIDCQAPAEDDARGARADVPGEPVLIEKGEMEKEDEFEVVNHEKDEELREKGDPEKVEGLKVQVLTYKITTWQSF